MTDLDRYAGQMVPVGAERDLRMFVDLVLKWNGKINLISRASEADIWVRHILDSVQIWPLSPESAKLWVDIGSGGGFPGLVLAILAKTLRPDLRFILIESDRRKAAFLLQVSKTLALRCDVRAERIESVKGLQADVLSARALAPLSVLLSLGQRLIVPQSVMIFPKGERFEGEIATARQEWQFQLTQIQSATNPAATLLRITDLHHV